MLCLVSFLRRKRTWLIGIPVLVVLVAVVGPFVYINFVQDDPPERLTLEDRSTTTTTPSSTPAGRDGVEGEWSLGPDSVVGYRVKEILFGQDTTAVGRTSDVTGVMSIAGTTVEEAGFTVEMATVTSDRDNRDNQFRGRIMDVAQFPTATFTLSQPIELGTAADASEVVSATALGELTLRGQTKTVAIDLEARQSGSTFEVVGSLPIVFAEWGIPNPSNPAASVGDEGELELLLTLTKH